MTHSGLLAGQVAIVTGGGSAAGRGPSVGEAVCRVLAEQGARTAVVDIDAKAAARTADAILESGGEALAMVADLTREADCRRAVAQTLDRFGRVDILVNNVAIGDGTVLHEVREEDWDRAIAVNVKSALFMSKYAIPLMTQGGAVVNLSSIAVDRPPVSLAYTATKCALEGMTRHIALQYGPQGVRCNAVRPGEIWTAMVDRHMADEAAVETRREAIRGRTALNANGDAWDAAHAVAFLAGPHGRWITGQILTLDGGASLLRPDAEWMSGRAYWKALR